MSTLQQDIQIVLDHFLAKGITLSLEEGNLKIKAPRGVVTASDLEHLKAHKQAIIAYLVALASVEEPASFPHDDEPLYVPQDYWEWVHTKALRPPVDSDGTPFCTPDAWAKKYEELQNWRPDEKLYSHYPGGYAGYCRLYQPKKGAA